MSNVSMDQDLPVAQQQPTTIFEYWLAVKRRRRMVLIITMMSICVAGAMAWLWPDRYSAVMRLQVEAPAMENTPAGRTTLQQSVESILTQKTLAAVVKEQNLCQQWADGGQPISEADAISQLRHKAQVSRRAEQSIVEVTVTDASETAALTLARAIVDCYLAQSMTAAKENRIATNDRLNQELTARRAELADNRSKLDDLNVKLALSAEEGQADARGIAHLQQQIATARLDLIIRDARVAAMERAARQEQYWAFAILSGDGEISPLVERRTSCDQEMSTLNGFGPNHPQVIRLNDLRATITAQLAARVQGRIEAAKADRDATAERIDSLTEQAEQWRGLAASVVTDQNAAKAAEQRDLFLQASCDQLETRIREQSLNLVPVRLPLSVLDEPKVARRPFGVMMFTTLGTALGVGLVLGVLAALTVNEGDHSFRYLVDVERSLGLPVMGVLGLLPAHARAQDRSTAKEGFRLLRNQLECVRSDQPFKSLCVVSAAAGEGKSSATAQLASVWVELGLRVLVVDTDLRNPSLHRLLGASNDFGLADFCVGERSIDSLIQTTSIPGLSVIAAGRASTDAVFLAPAKLRQMVATASRQFDMVLYDTAASLQVSDGLLVAREVGKCLMVLQHHCHPQHMARRAMRMIQRTGATFAGVVVNKIRADEQELFFGYDARYYYAQSADLKPLKALSNVASARRQAA